MKPSELVFQNHMLINHQLDSLNLTPIPNYDESLTLGQAMEELEKLNLPAIPII